MDCEIFHDKTRNLVIYRCPEQHQNLLKWGHGAKPINGEYVAMPATITNLQVARCLKLPVIRPLENYDYPRIGIDKPFEAQTETANFLAVNPRAFVLNDLGTGKTLSALWGADALMRDVEAQGGKLRAVIVCPLSTMQTVWADNIFGHFLGQRTAVIVHGTPEQRLAALAEPHDFYIINHDGLKSGVRRIRKKSRNGKQHTELEIGGFAAELQARKDIQLFIFDEVGAFRDYSTLRSRAAYALSSQRHCVWAMTGTPTPNGPIDAYGISKLVIDAKGELFTHYRNRVQFREPGSQHKWLYKAGAREEAFKLMEPAIRFSIDQCVDIPPLTPVWVKVPMTDEQLQAMREIRKQFVLDMQYGRVTAVNEAAVRTKLLQIASGAVYDDEHNAHRIPCLPRINALRELIDESLSKVIIFCPFISAVNMLNEGLTDFKRAIIIGETPRKQRDDTIRRFQNEDSLRVLIAQPSTIAEGQTLVTASTTTWWGPPDKTLVYLQANGRMHRPGQQRPCTVAHLFGCRLEQESYRRLMNNQSMQGLLLQMFKDGGDV